MEEKFIYQLDLASQSAALQLYVAVEFKKRTPLLSDVLNQLVFTPLNVSDGLERVPANLYRRLTRARDAIMIQRANIAAHFPSISRLDQCPQHDQCEIMCDYLWRVHLTKPLLKTQRPAKECRDSFIEAIKENDVIARACGDHLCHDITQFGKWKDRWDREEFILKDLIERVERVILGSE